ncbi:MAG: hypothetical protein IPK82_13545 [Polyangiaceae bacterium]|nr:hypothetical protein [Polyangiaceae bacterium]
MSLPAPAGSRVVVVFLAARTAFGLSMLAGVLRSLPTLWYLPLSREFVFGPKPQAFAMEYFGRTLTSFVIGTAVAVLVWMLSARPGVARFLQKPANVYSIAQVAALALLIDVSYFGWFFWTQPITPLDLPPGCVP